MATNMRGIKHGTAHAKVAGDDEMLRTGFHNGTPLEAGKVADSEPVDLFAPARGVAQANKDDDGQQQQQPQMRRLQEQEGEQGKKANDDPAPHQESTGAAGGRQGQ